MANHRSWRAVPRRVATEALRESRDRRAERVLPTMVRTGAAGVGLEGDAADVSRDRDDADERLDGGTARVDVNGAPAGAPLRRCAARALSTRVRYRLSDCWLAAAALPGGHCPCGHGRGRCRRAAAAAPGGRCWHGCK